MNAPIIAPKNKARIIMFGDSFVSSGNFGDLMVYFASLSGFELSINAISYNNKSSNFDYTAVDLVHPLKNAATPGFEFVKTCNTETLEWVLGDPNDADLLLLQAPRGEIFGAGCDAEGIMAAYMELCDRFKKSYPQGKILFIAPPAFDPNMDKIYWDKWYTSPLSQPTQKQLIADFASKLAEKVGGSVLNMQPAYDYFDQQQAGFSLLDKNLRHPSLMGSYYNCCVAFAAIFGLSCANIGFYGTLPESYALKIQNIAYRYVFGADAPAEPLKTKMLPHREEKDPRFENEKVDEIIKPLLAAAKAGYDRGAYFQYDMAALNQVVKSGSWRREMRVHPEDATPQRTRYTDCSCYVHNCYFDAYDHKLEKADDTKGLISREDLHVFYWDPKDGESAESAADRLIKVIKPGDAIVYRMYNEKFGHTMLYIGNGWLLHSTSHNFSGSSGNYDHNIGYDNRELVGTIRYDLLDLFLKPYGERYMFAPHCRVAVIRPAEKLGLQPCQRAIDRMNNLGDIVAYKLTTAPQGTSVNRGGEVKFTFVINNIGEHAKTVEIEDEVSSLLEITSTDGLCCEGGKIKGSVTVEGGEKKEVGYTVRIADTAPLGSFIECTSAAVGKVKVNDTDILVANTLTQAQQDAVSKAAKQCCGADGLELAKAVYAAIGASLPVSSLEDIQHAIFAPCDGAPDTEYFCAKNGSDTIARMAVPHLTGGNAYYIPRAEHDSRLRQVRKELFIPGDLLYTYDGSQRLLWVYAGDNRFVTATDGKTVTVSEMETFALLDGVLAKKCFCVLRPSMIN